ncbi:MAG: hypothetical protein ABH811_01740 [archaeon]
MKRLKEYLEILYFSDSIIPDLFQVIKACSEYGKRKYFTKEDVLCGLRGKNIKISSSRLDDYFRSLEEVGRSYGIIEFDSYRFFIN